MTILSASDVLAFTATGDTIILDARGGADAFNRYAKGHLEKAIFVDLDADLSEVPQDAANGGRHPLPELSNFSKLLGKWGITPTSRVMVYDDKNGAMAGARIWWMLKAIGHQEVYLINGGLSALMAAGLPIVTDSAPHLTDYTDYPVNGWQLPLADIDEVASAALDSTRLVIDVREGFRFRGEQEPIDLVAGHIPGAINIPYFENLDENGLYKGSEALKEFYTSALAEKDPSQVIVHCGSGVTACHTLAALEEAGLSGAKLYVGSWSEWSRNNREIATV